MKIEEIISTADHKLQPSQSKHLIGKLVMLNRLENVSVLLHNKLNEQKWGNSNATMFTEEQHRVLEIARNAFKNGTPLHLVGK